MTTFKTTRISAALAILSCCATWATAQDFNMRPGLWELTSSGETKGDPLSAMSAAERAQMEEAKAHMTPEQKAQMEAAMKQTMGMMGIGAKPRTSMACITKENIQKTFARVAVHDAGSTCRTTRIRQTSTLSESREVCSNGNESNGNTTLLFEVPTSETLIGTIHSSASRGSGGFEVNLKINGKWMGSSCGDVKP